MLNVAKLRNIYSKLQKQLFYMIPEKWESIYLYASIEEKINKFETGEMFFYYYPKGIFKKNPVNVYEIPSKFNIDEDVYMKLVDKLYETIKLIRQEYINAKEDLWSSLTISIENLQFKIEYEYNNIKNNRYSDYEKHIIWQYKYLKVALERFSKKDRKMLETYLQEEQFDNKEIKIYTENIYQKHVHNIIEFGRENDTNEILNEDENEQISIEEEKNLDKYELYKLKQKEERIKKSQIREDNIENDILNTIERQKNKNKNQILFIN